MTLLVALVCLLASACQVQSRIEVAVDLDGAGTVAVEVGLDQAALERLGDPDEALALDDLSDAGWQVTGPTPRDGWMWWRAEKGFDDTSGLTATLAEVAGPDVVVSGASFESLEVDGGTDHRLSATVDVSGGLEVLAEPALTETLGGDPFGGYVRALEEEEGRPVGEMVALEVVAVVDGERSTVLVHPGDAPVDLVSSRFVEEPTTPWLWPLVIGATVVVALVVAVTVRRRRSSSTLEPPPVAEASTV